LEVDVCPLDELPPGSSKTVFAGYQGACVFNIGGELHAIEDRCSHDDGPLCEGEWDCAACEVVCPRHGSRFDLRTGNALSLPAYMPVETYPVRVREDGMIVIDLQGEG